MFLYILECGTSRNYVGFTEDLHDLHDLLESFRSASVRPTRRWSAYADTGEYPKLVSKLIHMAHEHSATRREPGVFEGSDFEVLYRLADKIVPGAVEAVSFYPVKA